MAGNLFRFMVLVSIISSNFFVFGNVNIPLSLNYITGRNVSTFKISKDIEDSELIPQTNKTDAMNKIRISRDFASAIEEITSYVMQNDYKITDDLMNTDYKMGTLKLEINKYVEQQINYLYYEKRAFLDKAFERAQPYYHEMRDIIVENGLPEELVYLPIIESGFNSHAYSHMGAAGMWQFMPGTADWLGMKRNAWIDERLDPISACRNAVKFLKFLYNEFHDWNLVLAAYNYGGRNVKNAIRRAGSSDYYDLIKRGVLPLETMYYVPRFMATVLIAENKDILGLKFDPRRDMYAYKPVKFMTPVNYIADVIGLSRLVLTHYNPGLRSGFTPGTHHNYLLRVPVEYYEILDQKMEYIEKNSFKNFIVYYVKAGDNLSTIAQRYGVNQYTIMSLNNIRNSNRIWQGQKLYIPSIYNKAPTNNNNNQTHYFVKAGDTVSEIALRFGISSDTLIRLNNISDPSRIKVGQKLKVRNL